MAVHYGPVGPVYADPCAKEAPMFDIQKVSELIKTNLSPCYKDIRFVIGRDEQGYVGIRNDFNLDVDMEAPDGTYDTTMIKCIQKFVRELSEEMNINNIFIFIDGKRIVIDKQKPFDTVFQEQVEKMLGQEKNLKKVSIFVGGTIKYSGQELGPMPGNYPPPSQPTTPWNPPWGPTVTWGGGSTTTGIIPTTKNSPIIGIATCPGDVVYGVSDDTQGKISMAADKVSDHLSTKMEATLTEVADYFSNKKESK